MRLRITLLLLAVLIWGFALRLYTLDAKPFWFDEGLSVDLALAPPDYVLNTIDRPPLYYVLLHGWIKIAGVGPFTFRFFSAWWGALVLPLFYVLARQVLDRRAAWLTLLLAALSPFLVYYAQEARTYSLTLALLLASCWSMLKWLNDPRPHWLIVYGLTTLACLYTHYALLVLPVAQTLAVVWISVSRTTVNEQLQNRSIFTRIHSTALLHWFGVEAMVVLLFLPWPLHVRQNLPQLIAPEIEAAVAAPLPAAAHAAWTTLREFAVGRALPSPLADGLTLLFLFLVVLGALSPSLTTTARRFLLTGLLIPPLLILLLPRTAVYFAPKYLLAAAPAFYLLLVAGLEALRSVSPRWYWVLLAVVIAALLAGLAVWYFVAQSKVA